GGNTLFDAGSAYIFKRDINGVWNQVQKLVASDRNNHDYFGRTLSISGNFAIVGSQSSSDDTGGNQIYSAGAAYIFERYGNGKWNQVQKIVASDRTANDQFGKFVCINGSHAIVGAPYHEFDTSGGNYMLAAGAAYIFERDTLGNWNQVQKIVADDRAAMDGFGCSVSISGNYAIVGALYEDEDVSGINTKESAGSAYIFERDGSGIWNQIQKIVASDRSDTNIFGWSVCIDSFNIIVGSPRNDYDAMSALYLNDAGAVYIFETLSANISEIGTNISSYIFPNPTSGKINIDMGNTLKEIKATIRNILGQEVLSKQFNETTIINLEINGPPGLYFIEIITTTGISEQFKVVKT
ncbi:T9SS type A sorting domain-containing protein, partial [candidate division KSB1 bacterium]